MHYLNTLSHNCGVTDRVGADLLDVPLLVTAQRQNGDVAIRAAACQDQTKLIGTPTHRVDCTHTHTEGQTCDPSVLHGLYGDVQQVS